VAVEATTERLATLFEGAPRFVARLIAAGPYATDGDLLQGALAIARSMPQDEQLELINSHPRIGAPPASMSAPSYREQGYDREPPDVELQTMLERLNEQYERRFGFRFVVFVAGRPRAKIVLLIEERLRASPDQEKERALTDVVAIAGDRLARQRRMEAEQEK
jgi:2-oxo-4-hydroxy-4-carboxy--5-ureidoimidazoline (OHCU) decarboxylase